MTPKEYARGLFDKFYSEIEHQDLYWGVDEIAKQCALIAVDEILDSCIRDIAHLHYWVEVKTEIENI